MKLKIHFIIFDKFWNTNKMLFDTKDMHKILKMKGCICFIRMTNGMPKVQDLHTLAISNLN